MILVHATWQVPPKDRQRVIGSLQRVVEPTRALGGCSSCCVSTDVDNPNSIIYTEEWRDRESLEARLRNDGMKVLLSAVDVACAPPDFRIMEVQASDGIAAIMEAKHLREEPSPADPQEAPSIMAGTPSDGRTP